MAKEILATLTNCPLSLPIHCHFNWSAHVSSIWYDLIPSSVFGYSWWSSSLWLPQSHILQNIGTLVFLSTHDQPNSFFYSLYVLKHHDLCIIIFISLLCLVSEEVDIYYVSDSQISIFVPGDFFSSHRYFLQTYFQKSSFLSVPIFIIHISTLYKRTGHITVQYILILVVRCHNIFVNKALSHTYMHL